MKSNRREFLQGLMATGAMAVSGCATTFGKPTIDPNLTAFISDLHISATDPAAGHCAGHLRNRIAEILSGDRLPKRVVVFGDIAYLYGKKTDYVATRPLFQPLRDLGIEIVFGLGNHDRRGPFYEIFPEEAEKTLVPGRHVVKADLGSFDLLMLDSLDEPPKDDRWIGSGNLGKEQGAWLAAELPKWKKPVLVSAHHPIYDLSAEGRSLATHIANSKTAFGFVHGHCHQWSRNFCDNWDGVRILVRTLCLPSTGMWGDIGYAMMSATPTGCRVELVERDVYFPGDGPTRRPEWKLILEENRNQSCEFLFRS